MRPLTGAYNHARSAFIFACIMTVSTAVQSADLGGRRLDPVYEPQSAAHRYFYVRGDVGVARHDAGGFQQAELAANGGNILSSSVDDSVLIGLGIGAKISPRFRVDLTGEYRSTADIRVLDNLTATLVDPAGAVQANTHYNGSMSAYVGMLNGYWDLFTSRGVTPYLGAGIGFAHVRAHPFTTATSASFTAAGGSPVIELSNGHSVASSRTNLAWSLMAGMSFDLDERAKLDIGYRYLNMGSGVSLATGAIDCVCGTVGSPLKAADLVSHDIRIGVRWAFDAPAAAMHRPMK